MKRFNITNNKTDQKFSFTGESIEAVYPNGLPVEWGDDHTITEKDITGEINSKIAKEERLQALKDKHASMKVSDLDTLVELRQAVLEIQEILGIK